MSDLLRVALVAEGVTDYEIIQAALEAMLAPRSFVLHLLQPEESLAFTGSGAAGLLGGGWHGVFRWCAQANARNHSDIKNDPLFLGHDLLVIHLDAEVSSESAPQDLEDLQGRMPCNEPCPPANDGADALRAVVRDLLQANPCPQTVVFCTPSMNTETWVMAAFFPNDREMMKRGWECHLKPEGRLAQQPKKQRFRKSQAEYSKRAKVFSARWSRVVLLSEARRFNDEFQAAASRVTSGQ